MAFGTEGVVAQWQGDDVVQQHRLTDRFNRRVSFTPPGFVGAQAAFGPANASNGAVVAFVSPDGGENHARSFYLVDWSGDGLKMRSVDARFPAVNAVASGDGGIHVMNEEGRIRTYDGEGRWMAEMTVHVRDPLVAARSEEGLVPVSGLGGVAIVDPTVEEASVPIEGTGNVSGLAFVDGGRRLVTRDGRVRLWDVPTGESLGMLAGAAGSTPPSMPWFDSDSGAVWVASSGRLLEFSLDPSQWIAGACAFVGRDLTQEEWDRYVPGDEPLQSACS